MKTKLMESLKKRVLLIELPEIAHGLEITDKVNVSDGKGKKLSIMYYTRLKKNEETLDRYIEECFVMHQELGKWELLSSLKDISEEQCEELVESETFYHFEGTEAIRYKNYSVKYEDDLNWAQSSDYYEHSEDSFLSALEAEGLHLNGNPYGEKPTTKNTPNYAYSIIVRNWEKAEQNVFSENTLVFIEQ